MKSAILALSVSVAVVAGPALAGNCTSGGTYQQLNTQGLVSTLVEGKTACVPNGGPPWRNQEAHSAGGLTDYKLGPSDPVDPTDPLGTTGTYSISSSGMITYTYSAGVQFQYSVFEDSALQTGPNILVDYCPGGAPPALPVLFEPGTGHPC